MRRYYCDICGMPFTKGVKAEQGKPCTGTVGALISGLDICETCLDIIRHKQWEQRFLDVVKEEVRRYGEKQ